MRRGVVWVQKRQGLGRVDVLGGRGEDGPQGIVGVVGGPPRACVVGTFEAEEATVDLS